MSDKYCYVTVGRHITCSRLTLVRLLISVQFFVVWTTVSLCYTACLTAARGNYSLSNAASAQLGSPQRVPVIYHCTGFLFGDKWSTSSHAWSTSRCLISHRHIAHDINLVVSVCSDRHPKENLSFIERIVFLCATIISSLFRIWLRPDAVTGRPIC